MYSRRPLYNQIELKYVRSTRVNELYAKALAMLGTMDHTTFWLSMSSVVTWILFLLIRVVMFR